jgi:hypothetical protein
MSAMATLPKGKSLIPTRDAARMLGCSMARLRQLAKLGRKNGGVWSHKPTSTVLLFDEDEIAGRAKQEQVRGQPRKGFSAN